MAREKKLPGSERFFSGASSRELIDDTSKAMAAFLNFKLNFWCVQMFASGSPGWSKRDTFDTAIPAQSNQLFRLQGDDSVGFVA